MEYIDYIKLPFQELFYTVFTKDGHMKLCGRNACKALIKRLELHYDDPGSYGDIKLGRLKLPDAYLAGKQMLRETF